MGILFEVLRAIGYTALGVFAGYQFGKIRRGVEEIKEKAVTEDTQVLPPRKKDRRKVFGDRQSRVIGFVVLFMSLFTIVSSLYTNQETRSNAEHDAAVTQCQAEFNADFARAVTLRGQYADEDRTALNTMIFTIITEKDPAKQKQAVINWANTTRQNDARRKQIPLPVLDNRNCEDR